MDILDAGAFEQALRGLASQLAEDARFLIVPSPEQLDKLAENISQLVSTALAASTKRACRQGSGQPWWDQGCHSAVRQYRQKARDPDAEDEAVLAKRNLRRIVRKAKREYWRGKINTASEGKDIFQMVGWNRSTGSFDSTFCRP